MLLAAALAVTVMAAVAWVVAGPGPTPVPLPSATESVVPSASTASPPLSPTATSSVLPSGSPDAGAGIFRLNLIGGPLLNALPVLVMDRSGTVKGVAEGSGLGTVDAPVSVTAGPDPSALVVHWTGGVCDQLVRIEVDATSQTVTVSTAVLPGGCDLVGIDRAVELRFSGHVDASAFHGRILGRLALPTSVQPGTAAFTDPAHGFVGGTEASYGLAVVSETFDGGATWAISPVSWGTVVGLGLDGNEDPWAAVACGDTTDGCVAGLYTRTGTGWTRGLAMDPVRLAVSGRAVAVIEQLPIDPLASYAFPPRGLRLTRDGGTSWAILKDPCPATTSYATAVALDGEARLVVVCEGGGAGGGSNKTIWRSVGDVPGRWEKLADGPEPGTGMSMGLAPDGTGWLWGARSHLLATKDGGASWTSLTVADGDVRIVQGADAMGAGSGVVLVWDPDRRATLLLRTSDGKAWTEMHAYPAPQT
jgi:hypothetical protein